MKSVLLDVAEFKQNVVLWLLLLDEGPINRFLVFSGVLHNLNVTEHFLVVIDVFAEKRNVKFHHT